MKRTVPVLNEQRFRELMDRSFADFREVPAVQVKSACERVLQRLTEDPTGAAEDAAAADFEVVRPVWKRQWPAVAALAAAIALAALVPMTMLRRPPDGLKAAESADGARKIEYGEVVHANNAAGNTLVLADGSRVEMRSQSELVLERAYDGVRIRLNRGDVIVNAAKQGKGHLYVRTKDVTVSVVGTVFLVKAEEEGSRVAVIQGEVRVHQQGATEKKLLSGEQVATVPSMKPLPVAEEISWSRNAVMHVALLQQSTTASRLGFASVSIKPIDPANPVRPVGFACHGIDGNRRAPFGESGGPALVAPKGRCVGNGITLSSLVAFAYGIPHRFGAAAPDWAGAGTPTDVELAPGRTTRMLVRAGFQMEATVDDPLAANTDQMRQMVQTMLADRFKLKFHRDTQEVPGYVLLIAKNGTKLKEVSGDEIPLTVDYRVPDRPVLRGRARLDEFLRFLMGFSNPTGFMNFDLPSYVLDKTGLTGIYEYEFLMPIPGGYGGRRGAAPGGPPLPLDDPRSASERFAWRGPATAEALEEQLGLRMQPQKIPVEVLVIDQVEKPSPN